MNTRTILDKCTALGHKMERTPSVVRSTRFTCSTCQRAVVRLVGFKAWFGTAAEAWCDAPDSGQISPPNTGGP